MESAKGKLNKKDGNEEQSEQSSMAGEQYKVYCDNHLHKN